MQPKWRAILLFGAPGCGKGTQGAALGTLPGFVHVASGDIFRELDPASDLGCQVHGYTSQGKLVPDELTIGVWRGHVEDLARKGRFVPQRDVILSDGIPRTFEQARLLEPMLEVVRVFELALRDDEEAVQRIRGRALAQNRVDDADEAVIRHRLATYHEQTKGTLHFYDPSLVVRIDGSQRPIEVLRDLAEAIARSISPR